MRTQTNLFEYQDYRSFLHDYYKEKKEQKKNFSYRYFSEKAGIKAPSFLFYVIEGKRNLTKGTILKISQAIGFSRQEEEYFEYLVFFNQAKTIVEKTEYYSRLVEIRKPIDIAVIDKDRYEYYSGWYHSVIREVVTFFDFKGDFEKLGAFLVPQIRATEAKKSIFLLEQLGFIEQDKDGQFYQTQNLINAKPGIADAFVIEKFQVSMLQMAMQAYDRTEIHDRMMTSTTFSISRETFNLFKLRIRELHAQLMEMARIDGSPEFACQLTLNLFPVSRSTKNAGM